MPKQGGMVRTVEAMRAGGLRMAASLTLLLAIGTPAAAQGPLSTDAEALFRAYADCPVLGFAGCIGARPDSIAPFEALSPFTQAAPNSSGRTGRWLIPLAGAVLGAWVAYEVTSPHCSGTEYNSYCPEGLGWASLGAFFGVISGVIVAGQLFE